MRAQLISVSFALAFAFSSALSLLACGAAETAPVDVCEDATHRLAACGVALPIAAGGACAGPRRLVSQCLVSHADGCDEIATIMQRIDACVADMQSDGGDELLPPLEGVDLTFHDAGDAAQRGHASNDAARDAKKD